MAPFEDVIERAKARGELSSHRGTRRCGRPMSGPFFYRRWFAKQKMDKRFIDAMVDATIYGKS